MKNIPRRALGAAIAASGLTAANAVAAPAALKLDQIEKDAASACVYHLDFGDQRRYSQLLDNVRNHFAEYDFSPMALKLLIVAHSAGIKFFLTNLADTPWAADTLDPDLAKRMEALSMYGVQVLLCRTTFEKNGLSPDRARPVAWLSMVQSGVATVAALQDKGFAYVKVG